MIKILFIDEEQDNHDEFEDYIDNSPIKDEFDLFTKFPERDLVSMIAMINDLKIDAIICDFMLNEIKEDVHHTVEYTGSELIEQYLQIKSKFPCFIMTSYDDDAINVSEDVNKVYLKEILHTPDYKFLTRIKSQVEKYRNSIEEAETELALLIEKSKNNGLDVQEEQKLLKLDCFLEKSLDSRGTIPNELKGLSNQKKLSELLSKVDILIEKLDE